MHIYILFYISSYLCLFSFPISPHILPSRSLSCSQLAMSSWSPSAYVDADGELKSRAERGMAPLIAKLTGVLRLTTARYDLAAKEEQDQERKKKREGKEDGGFSAQMPSDTSQADNSDIHTSMSAGMANTVSVSAAPSGPERRQSAQRRLSVRFEDFTPAFLSPELHAECLNFEDIPYLTLRALISKYPSTTLQPLFSSLFSSLSVLVGNQY